MERDQSRPVARRQVFYIPGFDPFHPRRYRELYRKEGAVQAGLSGYHLQLQPSPKGEAFGWRVNAEIEGQATETRFEVLVWHDLVKAAMPDGVIATYWQLARTFWIYVGTGSFGPLVRLRKGPLLAALYPILMLLGQLALALALGWGGYRLGAQWLPVWAAGLIGLVVVALALRGFKWADRKLLAHYLLHDFAYSAKEYGGYDPALEARLRHFGARIEAALASGVDEVLVVGHSSGAHIGLSVLADLLRKGEDGQGRLSFLTLGQAIPMVAFLPKAQRLRGDLKLMGEQADIPWVDVTAPSDGCTYALCDPVAVNGLASEAQRWPLVLSAAFTQTLSEEKRASLKWRYFRIHFQYLCAFDQLPDRDDAYDYFRITAGPKRLWARLGARSPSASRITQAVAKHTDIQP